MSTSAAPLAPSRADSSRAAVSLLIVVVNFRTPQLTLESVASVASELEDFKPGEVELVVVENASGDDSAEALRGGVEAHGWSSWARIVVSEKNRGFAGGNNYGIEHGAPAEFVLFLNSDAMVHRGCLRHCVDRMRAEPTIGALSCRLLNPDGSMQNAARRFPSPGRALASALGLPGKWPRRFGWADLEDPIWDRTRETRDVDWLGGAFLMVRGDAIAQVGGWDEDFFFYGEDIEFCHRIRRAGYRCRYDAVESAVHIGGASSDPGRIPKTDRDRHRYKARYLVQRKMYGAGAAWTLRTTDALYWLFRWARAVVLRRDPAMASECAEVLRLILGRTGGSA